ncbi:MAG: Gar1/Naf1 family protein [Thermoproteota archaeon]|jgi:rRNA processing protein Gar1|nr:Gar1/Naf1 family protein [Thermoproteota archaeon]
MKLVGTVSHISKSKKIIIKAEDIPKLNSEVFSEDKEAIGIVIDIMGPVSSPFISVKPYKKENLERFIGKKVYIK